MKNNIEDLMIAVAMRDLKIEQLTAYANKLAAGLPEGPKDVELLREANASMAAEIERLTGTMKNPKHPRPHYAGAGLQGLCDWQKAEIERLTAELAQWQTWGTIEVAIRNPNVRSYMDHWEGRATKAEAERDQWKEWHANMQALRDKHSASVDRLMAEREQLRAALERIATYKYASECTKAIAREALTK